MAVTPQFIERPFLWINPLSVAGPARADSAPAGVLGTTLLGTASDQGALIDGIWAIASSTIADSTLRLWIKNPAIHTKPIFFYELSIPAATITNTAASTRLALTLPGIVTPVNGTGIRLGAGYELHGSLAVAPTTPITIACQGGHYTAAYGGTGGGTS
jgi:hypothetical protein